VAGGVTGSPQRMPTRTTTSRSVSTVTVRRRTSGPVASTGSRGHSATPRAFRSRHSADPRAADAVARAFARILAERYPGTSWLPVKRDEPGAHLGVPSGKVIRLLPGPADQDPLGGVRPTATPPTDSRATHEHRADTGLQ
jgi:hypothetical protein